MYYLSYVLDKFERTHQLCSKMIGKQFVCFLLGKQQFVYLKYTL